MLNKSASTPYTLQRYTELIRRDEHCDSLRIFLDSFFIFGCQIVDIVSIMYKPTTASENGNNKKNNWKERKKYLHLKMISSNWNLKLQLGFFFCFHRLRRKREKKNEEKKKHIIRLLSKRTLRCSRFCFVRFILCDKWRWREREICEWRFSFCSQFASKYCRNIKCIVRKTEEAKERIFL